MCYIRPIQRNLDTSRMMQEKIPCQVFETCLTCQDEVPIDELRDHILMCNNDSTEMPPAPKRLKQPPVCQYTCETKRQRANEYKTEKDTAPCPVCGVEYLADLLPTHASDCGMGESTSCIEKSKPKSLLEALGNIEIKGKEDKSWTIRVLRQAICETTLECLEDIEEHEWSMPWRVIFIGEEGVDAGGLSREFFTLFFRNTKMFSENKSFALKPEFLDKHLYYILGKLVAKALINGHPGPRCLSDAIGRYILSGDEPDFDTIEDLPGDAADAVKQISEAADITKVFEATLPVLEATGFTKLLTADNRNEAIKAIKAYYGFYRILGPIPQFRDGLKFRNVLTILQDFPDGINVLSLSLVPTAEEVIAFYSVHYSDGEEKNLEERVVYNFQRFLKKVEKGRLSSVWVNPYELGCEDNTKTLLNMGHVLNSLLGCSHIPLNLASGFVEFDHKTNMCSRVNTCIPSITFSDINGIKTYENFENAMIDIVVGAYGFGCV